MGDRGWREVIQEDGFQAEASVESAYMQVALNGTADLTCKRQLDYFLHNLHAQTLKHALNKVSVDLRRLEFIDSSCLKSLAWWVGAVQEQPPDRRYRIVFLSSPTMYWQRQSLGALASMANEIISVEH
jgi:hypothetical protein